MKEDVTQRVLKVLLLVCSITLPSSIFMAVLFFSERQEIESLQATLLSKNELQAELLKDQASDQAVMPHAVGDIGFVLNPHLKRSSLFAHEGETYAINALGLRGKQIRPKRAGVTRVLLVGDSIIFGWKLKDEDRLGDILNRYAAQRIPNQSVEFLTIALPGWNVRSEAAFLESHIRLLDPDVIVWWAIGNDIQDTAGVTPPGNLAGWASYQANHQSPVYHLSNFNMRGGALMPAIAERQLANADLIASFQSKYGVPIVLGGLPALEQYQQTHTFDPPQIWLPLQEQQDERWTLSASDEHPTAWANHIIAIGVLWKLSQLDKIPEVEFAAADVSIVQKFENLEARMLDGWRPLADDHSSLLAQIPTRYASEDGRESKSIFYGVKLESVMTRAGTLFLRDPGDSSFISLSLEPPPNMEKYPGTATFSVRNRDGEELHTTAKINADHIDVRLPIPKAREGTPVYEISWLFDYLLCKSPGTCRVGKLLHARFEP